MCEKKQLMDLIMEEFGYPVDGLKTIDLPPVNIKDLSNYSIKNSEKEKYS